MLSIQGYEQFREWVVGDLARVMRARETASGRPVIVKWMHDDLFSDDAMREVFLQEVRRLTTLDHPGLARTIEVGIHPQGKIYVVQEFVDGRTTADVARSERIPPHRALEWARQTALALDHAWTRMQCIHGHLHPDNIMIDAGGHVRVTDLGLSRLIARLGADGASSAAPWRGLRHYLAPEQVQGVGAFDARTDMVALGLVMYTWVTGRTPFGEQWNDDAAALLSTGRLTPPSACVPGIAAPFEALLSALTARERAERPPDWETVLREIAAVEGGRKLIHAPPGDSLIPVGTREPRAASAQAGNGSRTVNETQNGNRKIVLSAAQQEALRRRRPPRTISAFWYSAAAMLVAATGGLYGLHRLGIIDLAVLHPGRRATPDARPITADLPAQTASYRTEPALPPARPSVGHRIEVDDPPTAVETAARDSDFVRAARSFNAALELYADYQKTRDDPAQLRRIEALTQSALADFQSYRERNPSRRDVLRYIDQCYGLIRYARQTLLMDHGLAGRTGTPPRRERRRTERVTSDATLRLARDWQAPPHPEAVDAAEELLVLLGAHGTPRTDLTARPTIDVFPAIRYLMPVEDAAELYQVELPEGLLIRHPAFPAESVRVFVMTGAFPGGWPRLHLFTDLDGQIIAAQGVDENPETIRLAATLFSTRWQLADPGSGRTKTDAELLVAHQVRTVAGVVQIESELAQPDEGEEGPGEAMLRSVLFLPQPLVDLMLSRLSGR